MATWVDRASSARGPATELRVLALGVVIAWMWWDASESQARLGALGIVLLALLAIGLWTAFTRTGSWSRARRLMVGCMAALTIWSFLSILWADFPGVAWLGSNRILVYAAALALFTLWPTGRGEFELLLGMFGWAVALSGLVVLVRIMVLSSPEQIVMGGRLSEPLGYPGGNAALFLLGSLPAVMVAASPERRAWVRALALGSATLLTGLAVLTQSRTWLLGLPVAVVLLLVCTRRRLRTVFTLLILGVAVAAAVRPLNHVFATFWNEPDSFTSQAHHAALVLLLTAMAAAVAGLVWALVDARVTVRAETGRALAAAVAACSVIVLALGVTAAVVTVEHPRAWVEARWNEFTGGSRGDVTGSRLTESLGSARYEIWKTAALEFADHPVIGIGSDNFAAPFLLRRSDSWDQPVNPHSTPLRLLSQLGLLGFALCATTVGIALWRGACRRRAESVAAGNIVGASLAIFLYWLLLGSVDVFWETPALGALAFCLLGLAASPRSPAADEEGAANQPVTSGGVNRIIVVGLVLVLAIGAASLALTGVADAYRRSALGTALPPKTAYERLDRSTSLNPISASALIDKGLLAVRAGDDATAREAFAKALVREPTNWLPYMQLGLLDGAAAQWSDAETSLRRAQELNPKDPLVKIARRIVAARDPLDPALFAIVYDRSLYVMPMDWLIANYFQVPPFTDS